MIKEAIKKYLEEDENEFPYKIKKRVADMVSWNFERQFGKPYDSKSRLRVSNAGNCRRKLGYIYHGAEADGKEIDGRAKRIFAYGDYVELMLVALMEAAGIEVGWGLEKQMELEIEIEDETIKGHPDGIVYDPNLKEFTLLEIKSMTSWSIRDLEKREINREYLWQINLYMRRLGLNWCKFVAMQKDSGKIVEVNFKRNDEIVKEAYTHLKEVINSEKAGDLEKEYGVKRKYLDWHCSYCAYWKTCWGDKAERIIKNGKPKLIYKEE